MIVLLIAHDIDELVQPVLLEALFGGTEVLGHIYGSAVAPQEKFPVESVGSKVTPHRTVSLFLEDAHVKAFLDESLAEKIGLRLIICPVKRDSEVPVSLVEALVDPSVHLLPEVHNLLVPVLPPVEHLLGLLEGRGVFLGFLLRHAGGYKLIHLSLVHVIEGHIIVADEMVTLLAGRLRSLSVSFLKPGEH